MAFGRPEDLNQFILRREAERQDKERAEAKEGVEKQRQFEEEENDFKAQAGRDMMTLDEHDTLDYYGRF